MLVVEDNWPLYYGSFKTREDVLKITLLNVDDYFKRGLDPNWRLESQLPIFLCVNSHELYEIFIKRGADVNLNNFKFSNNYIGNLTSLYSGDYSIKFGEISEFLIDKYKDFMLQFPVRCFDNTSSLEMLKLLERNKYSFNFDRFQDRIVVWDAILSEGHEDIKIFLIDENRIDFNLEGKPWFSPTHITMKIGFIYLFHILYKPQSKDFGLSQLVDNKKRFNLFYNRIKSKFTINTKTVEGNNIFFILELLIRDKDEIAFEIMKLFVEFGANPFDKNNLGVSFYDLLKTNPKKYSDYIKFLEDTDFYKKENEPITNTSEPIIIDPINEANKINYANLMKDLSVGEIVKKISNILNRFEFNNKEDIINKVNVLINSSNDINNTILIVASYLNTVLNQKMLQDVKDDLYSLSYRSNNEPLNVDTELIKEMDTISHSLSVELFNLQNIVKNFNLLNVEDLTNLRKLFSIALPFRMVKTKNIHEIIPLETDKKIFSSIDVIQLRLLGIKGENDFYKVINDGELVYFHRDVENTYYKDAVVVANFSGYVLGFMPSHDGRKIAKTLSELIDKHAYIYGRITDSNNPKVDIFLDDNRKTKLESSIISIDYSSNYHINVLIKVLSFLRYKVSKGGLNLEEENEFLEYCENLYSNDADLNALLIHIIHMIRNEGTFESRYEL